MSELFVCNACNNLLTKIETKLICPSCQIEYAELYNGIPVFKNTIDKENFFDVQALKRLGAMYEGWTIDTFYKTLELTELYQMQSLDKPNKKVGITKKKWWEKYVGKIEYKCVLEVGCGVNYLVPYWLLSHNEVYAFDMSKEAVIFLKRILDQLGINQDQFHLFVENAEKVNMDIKFDVINVNNVLHHVSDKRKALKKLYDMLGKDGKLLLVEPNYYYPPRWIVETDVFHKLNVIKSFFVDKDLIERGEKAIIFSELHKIISDVGFKIDMSIKDNNYLGYAITYFIDRKSWLPSILYFMDTKIISRLTPRLFAPFEYLILTK